MKIIPKKNYIIVIFILIFTYILTFYLMNNYKSNNNLLSFVSEIKYNEISDYITENQEVVIYMSLSNNKITKDLEKELEKLTIKKNLKNKYLYLNLNKANNNFYNEFYVNYIDEAREKEFEIKAPTIVLIENGRMTNYLNNINNIEQIEEFFKKTGVIE